MRKSIWLIAMMPLVLSTLCAVPSSVIAQAKVQTTIRLTGANMGGVRPEGKSTYVSKGNRSSFRAEVSRINLANGTILNVIVNRVRVGRITLSAGVGSLALNTELGQAVPTISAGTTVNITNTSGAVIVSGSF